MNAHWKQRPEGGGRFAIGLIRSIGCHGGRTLARLLLYPITLYFLLRRAPERHASRQWLGAALGRPAGLLDVARHIHTFAATILDRLFLLSDSPERMTRRFSVDVSGLDALHAQLDSGRGLLLFGSHLGSFEVLRVLARKRPEYTIRVVLDKAHNAAITQTLDALNPDVAATVIDAGQDGPALMLAIQQAVQDGALVALLVDRVQPGAQSVAVPFFGRDARFPTAPWMIAAALKAPVALAFGLYRGGNRYELRFEHFSDGIDAPRARRAAAIAEHIHRYVDRLEQAARSAPYNWFNFYDFWRHDDPTHALPPHHDASQGADMRDDAVRDSGSRLSGDRDAAGRRAGAGR